MSNVRFIYQSSMIARLESLLSCFYFKSARNELLALAECAAMSIESVFLNIETHSHFLAGAVNVVHNLNTSETEVFDCS